MIGKAGLGSYAKGILEYCYYEKKNLSESKRQQLTAKDVRGELVYIQNLGIDYKHDGRLNIDYLSKQFVHNRNHNKNLSKFIWHQTFSFPPEEKVSKETMWTICERFSEEFGFENNQLIAFIHRDTAHEHFHIVANRVSGNGKNTADHFNNYRRTGDFCRKIELELGLKITAEMNLKRKEKALGIDQDPKVVLQQQLPRILTASGNFNEFTRFMKKEGFSCDIGRGLTFIQITTGQKIKGSDVGREYSLQNVKKRLDQEQEAGHSQKQKISRGMRL